MENIVLSSTKNSLNINISTDTCLEVDEYQTIRKRINSNKVPNVIPVNPSLLENDTLRKIKKKQNL